MADAYLTFDTKLNTAGFKSGLGQVTGMFTKLATLAGVAFSVGAVVAFGKAAVQAASQAEAKFKGLDFLMKANGRSMQTATSFIKEFTADGLVPMTSAYEAYKNMVSRGYSTEQIEKMLSVMKDAAVYNRQGQFSMGEAIEKATMGLRMENSLLTDSVGIQKNVAKMWGEYANKIGTTANNLTMLQKRQAEFEGFMSEGGVFAGAAAEYANSYAGKVATISAAFKELQISVGNAIIPFINALLPAITTAILWFTKLFNIVGRVVNLLFGTNVGMADAEAAIAGNAEATAAATGETAANTEKAGKAAKGALASFDKINVLAQDTSESGGGATPAVSSGGAPAVIDDTGGVSDALDDLSEKVAKFKEDMLAFFAPLREPFARLSNAFSTLGGLIKTGLGWAWDNILKPFALWLAGDVAPAVIDIISAALDVLNETIIALKPLGQWLWDNLLKPLAEWTGGVIVSVLEGIASALTSFSNWISTHQETVQTFAIILGSFAAAWGLVNIAIGIWNVVGAIAAGVTTLFGAAVAFLTSPIGLVVLAIGALIAIGVLLWKNWDKIKEWGVQAWENIKAAWGYASAWFDDEVVKPVVQFFTDLWADVEEFATTAWNSIVGVWQTVANWFDTNVISPISTAFETAWNAIKGFMEAPFEGLGEFVKGVFNNVIDFINGLLAGITSGINGVIDRINGLSFTPPQWAQDLLGVGTIGFNINNVSTPQIQRLATGAVIPPNAPFMAVMGDQKSGTNIEAPENLIRKIIREEMVGRNAFPDQAMVQTTVMLDSAVLQRAMKREQLRVGPSMLSRSGA